MELISKDVVLDIIRKAANIYPRRGLGGRWSYRHHNEAWNGALDMVKAELDSMPPQENIIYCKDCAKHNRRIGDFKEMPNGEVIWYWKYNACPLAEFRGKAQGHEFDYQYCVYGEQKGAEDVRESDTDDPR